MVSEWSSLSTGVPASVVVGLTCASVTAIPPRVIAFRLWGLPPPDRPGIGFRSIDCESMLVDRFQARPFTNHAFDILGPAAPPAHQVVMTAPDPPPETSAGARSATSGQLAAPW